MQCNTHYLTSELILLPEKKVRKDVEIWKRKLRRSIRKWKQNSRQCESVIQDIDVSRNRWMCNICRKQGQKYQVMRHLIILLINTDI